MDLFLALLCKALWSPTISCLSLTDRFQFLGQLLVTSRSCPGQWVKEDSEVESGLCEEDHDN